MQAIGCNIFQRIILKSAELEMFDAVSSEGGRGSLAEFQAEVIPPTCDQSGCRRFERVTDRV